MGVSKIGNGPITPWIGILTSAAEIYVSGTQEEYESAVSQSNKNAGVRGNW